MLLLRRYSVFITGILLVIFSIQVAVISNNKSIVWGHNFFDGQGIFGRLTAPVQSVLSNGINSIESIWRRYFDLVNVETEKEQLLQRIKGLESENSRLLEFEQENKNLRSLLSLKEKTRLQGKVCSIIGRSVTSWSKTVTIDMGSEDGLKRGMSVIDGSAVVGQVAYLGPKTATVILLSDARSAIDVFIQSSRAGGIVEGGVGLNALSMKYALKLPEMTIRIGDRVVASGMDGVFPKGVLVGVVSNVNSNSKGLFQDVIVKPNLDIYKLERVFVVTGGKEY